VCRHQSPHACRAGTQLPSYSVNQL
jgi:hypothetical protein